MGKINLPEAIDAELRCRYAEPHRHYHAMPHIEACLELFERHRHLFVDPVAVEWAIWFHDAIYDPKRGDNEQASAELARSLLTGVIGAEKIDKVAALIMATTHKSAVADPDAQLLTDIDLSILAAPVEDFDRYEKQVRLEYEHVPDDAFRAGRSAFLRSFLKRPTLYATQLFREAYEARARENLARSLARLDSPAPL